MKFFNKIFIFVMLFNTTHHDNKLFSHLKYTSQAGATSPCDGVEQPPVCTGSFVMEEPYRPFKLSKSRQKRVDNRDKILKFRENRDVAKRFVIELKSKATPAELILLQELLTGNYSFFFQRRLVKHDRFCIADFLINCEKKKIIIELDGNHHYTPKGLAHDKDRDEWIKSNFKVTIKRYPNYVIYNKLSDVMAWIKEQNPKFNPAII